MAKRPNQKVRLLLIADFIVKHSDEANGFYVKDIKEYLDEKGIVSEYHAITDDIKILRDQFKMDIVGGGGRGRPFFLASRHFPFEDIRTISECIGTAQFLSEEEATRLNETLKGFCSIEQAKEIDKDYFVVERPRKTQEGILDSLDTIRDAIKNNNKIKFKYTKRSLRGFSKIYRRLEAYTVSPFQVVLSEGKHYLIGFDDKRKRITAYRISRMEEVKNTYDPRANEEKFKFIGISDYARQTFGMFIGSRAKRITMICHNNLLDTMIERFGTSTATYKKKDEDHFTITTGIVVSPQFYGWLLGLGGLAVIEDSGEEDSVAKKYLSYIEKMKEIQQKSVE